MSTQTKLQFKQPIRNALAKINRALGYDYYNDIVNNRVTHRRFKFTLSERVPLTEQELETFVSTLQESFPNHRVEAKNYLWYNTQCVVTYLRKTVPGWNLVTV